MRVHGNGRRESMFWTVAVVVVLLGVTAWQARMVEIGGRVSLRSWDGAVTVPQPARAAVLARSALAEQLQHRVAKLPAEQAAAAVAVDAARRAWRENSEKRDEALRILRVAERSNAADLAVCRERHAEAAVAVDEAYEVLERRMQKADQLANPAALLEPLPDPLAVTEVGADGSFALQARVWHRPVVVVLAGEGGAAGQAWLQAVDAPVGGRVEVEFSNADLLTVEGVRRFLGLPAPRRAAVRQEAAPGDQGG
jgi:hypothetical protein